MALNIRVVISGTTLSAILTRLEWSNFSQFT